jgi:excisionase family DNA binding protein
MKNTRPAQIQTGLLTKQEVARSLNICVRSVENLMAARRLAHIRIGRAVRFEGSELERFKASLTVQANA